MIGGRLSTTAILAASLLAGGCAATKAAPGHATAQRTLADVMPESDSTILDRVNDPWEGWNRRVYDFNARFDRYLFIPVVEGYKRVVPAPARTSVSNFMRNIREILNVGNALLQFRLRTAARSTGRFAVNSTVGFAGLLDPATEMGLFYQKEDFGQTLGVWGLGPGPYMVLPLLGPSSTRDAAGLAVDWYAWQQLNLFGYVEWSEDQFLNWPTLLYAVDTRANIAFRYYELGNVYEYLWVRQLYLELREFQIKR